MTTVRPTIGLFAGIFNSDGKLLVKRRPQNESLPGDWDLPGGGVEENAAKEILNERIIASELAREVGEEIGLEVESMIQPMPAMYPATLSDKDWAFVVIIGVVNETPTKGEYKYVSPAELMELAEASVGNRLVSGIGKRMHRMCLRVLASRDSPNEKYREEAAKMLHRVQI